MLNDLISIVCLLLHYEEDCNGALQPWILYLSSLACMCVCVCVEKVALAGKTKSLNGCPGMIC